MKMAPSRLSPEPSILTPSSLSFPTAQNTSGAVDGTPNFHGYDHITVSTHQNLVVLQVCFSNSRTTRYLTDFYSVVCWQRQASSFLLYHPSRILHDSIQRSQDWKPIHCITRRGEWQYQIRPHLAHQIIFLP